MSVFVEPFWNVSRDGPSPRYGFTFGMALPYPGFWQGGERGSQEP